MVFIFLHGLDSLRLVFSGAFLDNLAIDNVRCSVLAVDVQEHFESCTAANTREGNVELAVTKNFADEIDANELEGLVASMYSTTLLCGCDFSCNHNFISRHSSGDNSGNKIFLLLFVSYFCELKKKTSHLRVISWDSDSIDGSTASIDSMMVSVCCAAFLSNLRKILRTFFILCST